MGSDMVEPRTHMKKSQKIPEILKILFNVYPKLYQLPHPHETCTCTHRYGYLFHRTVTTVSLQLGWASPVCSAARPRSMWVLLALPICIMCLLFLQCVQC